MTVRRLAIAVLLIVVSDFAMAIVGVPAWLQGLMNIWCYYVVVPPPWKRARRDRSER